eukprot:gnl/MRDRNA2_/MRDRNA2_162047_c0_seq1.p1 gnl/MRDRNA2_/MRDRNA2_162047_c0~~gnl/MRDRNA2_/MRDRNA2_162047_c0_seq1.p1  ORF type:complete len:875 (-),score=139.58 gnl/MRDRNA2_/MRDRNA2_162047_c0_seq1:118-2742(-)
MGRSRPNHERKRPAEKLRASLSRTSIVLTKEHEDLQQSIFLGAKGTSGLRQCLVNRYGSVTAGWLKVFEIPPFDIGGLGRVSFQQFARACCTLKYAGKVKLLWEEIAGDRTDSCATITLQDIDKVAGELLGGFRTLLMEQFGCMLVAWRKGLDVNGTFQLSLPEFVERCKSLGFEKNAAKLFKQLQPSGQYLRLEDIDSRASESLYRGDASMLMSDSWKRGAPQLDEKSASSSIPAQTSATSTFTEDFQNDRIPYPLREDSGQRSGEANSLPVANCNPSETAFQEFKRFLIFKFGSLAIAWQCHLDKEGKGQVSFGNLCLFLKSVAYQGDVRDLWKRLDPHGTGFLTPAALDPGIPEVIKFKQWLCEKYTDLLNAWKTVFDPQRKNPESKGGGRLDEAAFVKGCEHAGWTKGAESLWQTIVPDSRAVPDGFLTLRVFDLPTYETRLQGRRDPNLFPEKSPVIEDFRLLLVRHYGSVVNAWRQALNPKHKDHLAFGEFCAACRRFGYTGSVKRLWMELGCHVTGNLSLRDLDDEASNDIAQFHKKLSNKYGDVWNAWQQCLDPMGSGQTSEQDFLRCCKEVGYKGDPFHLLKLFRPNPGPKGPCGPVTFASLHPAADLLRWHNKSSPQLTKSSAQVSTQSEADAAEQLTRIGSSITQSSQAPVASEIHRCLSARCGSIVAAWRHILDPSSRGAISFGELCYHLRREGFHGYFRALWEQLDPENRGYATLADFDPEVDAELCNFRNILLERFPNLSAAWSEALEPAGGWHLTQKEFISRCEPLGVNAAHAKRLFHWFLPDPFTVGRHDVTQSDIAEVLLLGIPKTDRLRIWGCTTLPGSNAQVPMPEALEPGTRLPSITAPRGLARPRSFPSFLIS